MRSTTNVINRHCDQPLLLSNHRYHVSSGDLINGDGCSVDGVSALDSWLWRQRLDPRVVASQLGPEDPSFRVLPGRPKFTVRRCKFNEDSLS